MLKVHVNYIKKHVILLQTDVSIFRHRATKLHNSYSTEEGKRTHMWKSGDKYKLYFLITSINCILRATDLGWETFTTECW